MVTTFERARRYPYHIDDVEGLSADGLRNLPAIADLIAYETVTAIRVEQHMHGKRCPDYGADARGDYECFPEYTRDVVTWTRETVG